MSKFTPPCNSHASKLIRLSLSLTLVLTSLPVRSNRVAAQSVNQADKPAQSRRDTPHKDLPNLQEVMDEGSGRKAKPKAKDAPLKPAQQCRFRDIACHERQKASGKQIGAVTPAAPPAEQSASVAAKSEGNWFKRLGRKLSGALTSAASSALTSSTHAGNSLLPATTTKMAAAAPPPPPTFASLNEAKLDPRYRIGTGGEDLFSGNYHWSTPLVRLPGRNGLDLNLSLHYNSLQWVRYGNTMYYDPDWYVTLPTGLTTGFNLGFPEIENGYSYDGVASYVVTLPSGYRVPMRLVPGSTTKYEAADGSYMYLVLNGSNPAVLYMPDGTQYTYGAYSYVSGGKRCSLIRDSNGNRINISYGIYGISTITDTSGRVLNFVYETTYGHLMQITQNWLGQTHVLAQFDYDLRTFSYNFPGLTVNAPTNNSQISVLTRVITSDGARHAFVYGGWGLVEDIFLYGALDNQRAALDYAFPATSTALSDAPRFSQRNTGIWGFAGQWNDANGLGWVENYFLFDANESWGKMRTPDGVVHVEQFLTSGNKRGLSSGMETWTGTVNWQGGTRRKWTTTNWDSDGTNYPRYPRVTDTNVYDDADGNGTADNRRRATLEYWQFTAAGTMPYTVYLPKVAKEYAADASTVYRSTETDYLNNTSYWSRWIVGLPSQTRLKDGANTLQAQTSYGYDEAPADTHSSAILQHDTSSYGASFYTRGNLTSTRRHDIANVNNYTQTFAEYYVTGNVARAYDPLNHSTKFYYDDAFATYANDEYNTETVVSLTTKTWAYPTRVEDADNYSSYVKYWYDTGAPTRTTDPKGAAAISIYETTYGRLLKAKNLVNSAYTRYVYDTGHNWVQTWSPINDATETAILHLLDGAGRERQRIDEHPGSVGTLSSSYRVYDLMGRVVEWSNPTEINGQANCGQPGQPACWAPTGDDTAYVYSRQDYDWNHRPTITYNQDYDVNTNPNSKRTISYTGCGCAGGLITTVTDEMQRTRKAYSDFLGRTYKTEIMNGTSVYSSTQTTFNERDQIINSTEYAGAVGSGGASQQTEMTYDGYGRLATRKRPQETSATIYSYYANDQIMSSTDARGASGTLTYNARGLMTQAMYSVPAGVATTPTVTFQYDVAGNRLEMDDGPGKVTYEYNTLSQITKETRTFDDLPGQSFQLQYEYNLSGQVTKLTDPTNAYINYAYDKTGRTTAITGSSFGGVTQYATGIAYRAWNVPKAASYGSGFAAGAKYNARLQVKEFDIPGVIGGTYTYNLDGQISSFAPSTPQSSDYDWRMSRSFSYDAIGRINNSQAAGGSSLFPYAYNPTYDEFNNITSSSYLYWQSGNTTVTFSATYQNNKAVTVTDAGTAQTWNYDAMGNRTSLVRNGTTVESVQVDAVGRAQNGPLDGEGQPITPQSYSGYYVRSSVFGGQIITELNYTGAKYKGRVLDSGRLLAEQIVGASGNFVQWHHRDPLNLVARDTEPGQVKRRTFAINPVGAQIETTEGVNISQYYACLYGGQNNPTCTGYTPQPPGGYGAAADQAHGGFVSGLKVDGALTIRTPSEILAQAQRAGITAGVWISPALSGTPMGAALGISFIRQTNYDVISTPTIYSEDGSIISQGQRILDISDSFVWVPVGVVTASRNSRSLHKGQLLLQRSPPHQQARLHLMRKHVLTFAQCLSGKGIGEQQLPPTCQVR